MVASNCYSVQMEHTIDIEKVITGGKGLGRLPDNMVVMVPSVLPNERILVRETRRFRNHLDAELIEIITPSTQRQKPPCPYYESCGGCDLQHAPYDYQLALKQNILKEALERARLTSSPEPILPSPDAFNYRFRIRLHLDNKGNLGFHRSASNTIIPINCCLLVSDKMNRIIAGLAQPAVTRGLKNGYNQIELIQSPVNNEVTTVLHHRSAKPHPVAPGLEQILLELADHVVIKNGQRYQTVPHGAKFPVMAQDFELRGSPYRLQWDSGCFFQVNVAQNTHLTALACSLFGQVAGCSVLDLYCGMGNFSIALALHGAKVTGVEHNKHSITWAKKNMQSAAENLQFICADVEQYVRETSASGKRYDRILLDPPRQGLGKSSLLLAQLKPKQIVYVSCDPATLSRDLGLMVGNGYRLVTIVPVDMFPQTHHIESVALLEKN